MWNDKEERKQIVKKIVDGKIYTMPVIVIDEYLTNDRDDFGIASWYNDPTVQIFKVIDYTSGNYANI